MSGHSSYRERTFNEPIDPIFQKTKQWTKDVKIVHCHRCHGLCVVGNNFIDTKTNLYYDKLCVEKLVGENKGKYHD